MPDSLFTLVPELELIWSKKRLEDIKKEGDSNKNLVYNLALFG